MAKDMDIDWRPRRVGGPARVQTMIDAGLIRAFTVRGVTGTINQLLRHFDIPLGYRTVASRVQAGMPIEQALFTPSRNKRQVFTVRGVSGTITQLIGHFGLSISKDVARRRVALGWDIESALFGQRRGDFLPNQQEE